MVALLVIFTIISCLIIDSIVLSVRTHSIADINIAVANSREIPSELIFAQDGGTPIEKNNKKE